MELKILMETMGLVTKRTLQWHGNKLGENNKNTPKYGIEKKKWLKPEIRL